jgi:hypothetical protein
MWKATMGSLSEQAAAPLYAIPQTTFVSVEHPFEIENADKCVKTLGGDYEISKVPTIPS